MKVIDLTHTIREDMPVYPGTETPRLETANTYEKDFFKETKMTMYTHTGTHVDPPAHIFAGRTTLDQFPARDTFRRLKSLVHYNVMQQKDNNGIYIVDGYAAKLDYPVNQQALDYALGRLNFVYETYLQPNGSKVYAAVIPDKSYYLAEKNGYPAMDYVQLFDRVQQQIPWATHISRSISAYSATME